MSKLSLGYVIVYVPDVARAVDFWQRAFGLELGFAHESGTYSELATGATKLGFVAESQASDNGVNFRPNRPAEPAPGVEVALVTKDVEGAYERAVDAGATAVAKPKEKPWGQVVGYVRDPDGVLVELCSPMD